MQKLKIKRASALVVLLAIAAFSATSLPAARAVAHDNSPDLPSPLCDSIDVPVGNKVSIMPTLRACRCTDGTARPGRLLSRWRPCSQTRVSRKSRHSLSWTNLGEQQWQQSARGSCAKYRLYAGGERHSLAAAPDSFDRWSRPLQFGDLHPACEH